jgi:hypothetical protein
MKLIRRVLAYPIGLFDKNLVPLEEADNVVLFNRRIGGNAFAFRLCEAQRLRLFVFKSNIDL